jgi:ATP-binding cassette subfamily B (MDR/TAP) protein 1
MEFTIRYKEALESIHQMQSKSSLMYGITFGFSQGVIFLAYAAAFTLGAYLVEIEETDFEGLMKVFTALIFGAMAIGQAGSMAPDAAKSNAASAQIFKIMDRKSAIGGCHD